MGKKFKNTARVEASECLAEGIYSLWLSDGEIAKEALPGQFVSLYCKDSGRLLPRPISLCEIDKEKGRIRLVYRTVGKGTKEFSHLKAGDTIEIMGPLGNGFTLEGKKIILLGGGIGIPPMLELSKAFRDFSGCEVQIVLGYRDGRLFLSEEFKPYGRVFIATEDGSAGTCGNVLDAVREQELSADMIFACGPLPMLRGVQAYAGERGIRAQISMEERMACGIGACLACVCGSKETDPHTNVRNKRVCKDGPVFYADEIEL